MSGLWIALLPIITVIAAEVYAAGIMPVRISYDGETIYTTRWAILRASIRLALEFGGTTGLRLRIAYLRNAIVQAWGLMRSAQ